VEVPFAVCASWIVLECGDALAIEALPGTPTVRRLVRCREDGTTRVLDEEPGLSCAVESGGVLLVGSRSGEVRRRGSGPEPDVAECASLDGPITALASAGERGGAYVVYGESGARLGLLGRDLSVLWTVPCGDQCVEIAATPDGQHAWVVDAAGPRIRRFARDGSLEIDLSCPGLEGVGGIATTDSGGVVLAVPGAVLRFDGHGRARPGQGGFVFLTDVDRIPGALRSGSPDPQGDP
jgi:hypothetical protein